MSVSPRPFRAGESRRPRAPVRAWIRRQKCASDSRRNRVAYWPHFFGRAGFDHALESRHATIARMMLVPFSASSMLSASLRPGRWPGLRALTMPARGTDWQLRDGGRTDEAHKDVRHTTTLTTASIERMLGSSPQCRTALLRFVATASGGRIRPMLPGHGLSAPFTTSQFGIRGLWPCRVLRTTRRQQAAFTSGTITPWIN